MSLDANIALADVPPNERLAALCLYVLADEDSAAGGLAALITVAAHLSRRLSSVDRQTMALHLLREATKLDVRLH